MNKIIIANWKSNPSSLEEAQELFKSEIEIAQQYQNVQIVICSPLNFLKELVKTNQTRLGAQDVFWQSKPDFSLSHVLIGHSDRRYGLGETDETVNQKLKTALKAAVTPVLLVGEREKGQLWEEVLADQLTKDLASLSAEQVVKILFCYEPVWAISTSTGGHADTPENALEAIRFIKNFLITRNQLPETNYQFLYGGSINENNVADFLKHPEISGAVVGKASLDANQFGKILEITNSL